MIKVSYDFGTFSIDDGKIICKDSEIVKLFKKVDKETLPHEGEVDFVLADRFLKFLGGGKVLYNLAEDFDETITY